MLLGFSIAVLGFLTPRAKASALDDALDCLNSQDGIEQRQASLLRAADSLGLQIEQARDGGKGAPQGLLRRADAMQREAMDVQLELMSQRQACRRLAERALPEVAARLRELESAVASGRLQTSQAQDLLRLRQSRDRLQSAAAGPLAIEYPLLQPDSSDTQESLRAKMQYHQEVIRALRDLESRVEVRRAELSEERRGLVEARRFLQDLNFLDEGGRVSPSGTARLRGGPDGGSPGGVSRARGSATVAGDAGDLELALGLTPTTPEESDRLLRLLEEFRSSIQRELEAATKATDRIQERIVPEPAPPD